MCIHSLNSSDMCPPCRLEEMREVHTERDRLAARVAELEADQQRILRDGFKATSEDEGEIRRLKACVAELEAAWDEALTDLDSALQIASESRCECGDPAINDLGSRPCDQCDAWSAAFRAARRALAPAPEESAGGSSAAFGEPRTPSAPPPGPSSPFTLGIGQPCRYCKTPLKEGDDIGFMDGGKSFWHISCEAEMYGAKPSSPVPTKERGE